MRKKCYKSNAKISRLGGMVARKVWVGLVKKDTKKYKTRKNYERRQKTETMEINKKYHFTLKSGNISKRMIPHQNT